MGWRDGDKSRKYARRPLGLQALAGESFGSCKCPSARVRLFFVGAGQSDTRTFHLARSNHRGSPLY